MKISYEKINPDEGSSFRVLHINVPTSELKWEYHYHPEIELVCVVSGSGTRHVGYHKSNFTDRDLVLIGSNIPHSGFGLNSVDPHEEIVIQFDEELIFSSEKITETKKIKKFIEKAKYGICFSNETKIAILPSLLEILNSQGYRRYILLLTILHQLSEEENYVLLNDEVMPYTLLSKNSDRLQKVFTFVENNYYKEISMDEIAKKANLTLPAFCNFFKKTTHITFTEFVNRFRINKACQMIAQGQNVSESCYNSGFNSISYFSRIFKKYTGKTPSEYKSIF
jgi:AraC-like DNA-binding protein/mannose-6-phosphate isomerase-like protein (cupin superfamily)